MTEQQRKTAFIAREVMWGEQRRNGRLVKVRSDFRPYESWDDCMEVQAKVLAGEKGDDYLWTMYEMAYERKVGGMETKQLLTATREQRMDAVCEAYGYKEGQDGL
jgi:hypothetical protein